jgi:DeoR family transcriptional regulator of aga operon
MSKKEQQISLIPEQRRRMFFDMIRHRGAVSVVELAELTGISASTVRRDLAKLDSDGSIQRSHGGATISLSQRTTFEPGSEFASRMARPEKEAIGCEAAKILQHEQSVIFDSSSTVYQVARKVVLDRLPVTAITNDLEISKLFMESKQARLINLGGVLRRGTYTLLGDPGRSFLKTLHADICFLGIQGIANGRLSDSSLEVAAVKRRMLEAAGIKVLLADSTKFGEQAFNDVCGLNQLDFIITDDAVDPRHLDELDKLGVMVRVVKTK